MSKDIYGDELVEGDKVAFITTGGYSHYGSLNRGTFIGVGRPGGFKITYPSRGGRLIKTTLQRNRVIKITPAQPAWRWLGTRETSYRGK